MKHGSLAGYAAPEVKDYGSLREMTAAAHLLMGAAPISDLSFSSPMAPGGPGTVGGGSNPPGPGQVAPTTQGTIGDVADGGGPNGGGAPGSGTLGAGGSSSGGSSGGGSSGGGGQLPFTGFAAGVAAAIGSAFTAGGALLRRASRRRPD